VVNESRSVIKRRMGRRSWMLALALTATTIASIGHAATHENAAWVPGTPLLGSNLTRDSFLNPSPADRPWVRWDLPVSVAVPELEKELRQIKAAGVAGVELGQNGAYPTTEQLRELLKFANNLNIKVTFFGGPINAPAGFSLDDDQARKTLVFGEAVANTSTPFSGILPAPDRVSRKSLVAVQAYRCSSTCVIGKLAGLDAATRIDLTGQVIPTARNGVGKAVSEGRLNWTPPGSGQWVVLAIWSAGYLAQPDLLTREGTKTLTDSLDRFFAPMVDELTKNGGDFFFDSHSAYRGDPIETWSNSMEADFKAQTGYSVSPYLPLLLRQPATSWQPPALAFKFDDITSVRFRNDFDQARTDLWLHNHIEPLKRWALHYNRHILLQPYGDNIESIDLIEAAAALDKPETETLWYGDVVDNYLPEASANHMKRQSWYSLEGSAVVNGAYAQSFKDQVTHVNRAYAGGVTKLIYHIYPYDIASDAHWPGYSEFSNSFGNSWGPRDPDWVNARGYNDYFARMQEVLTQGDANVDVAVYMQNYVWPQPYVEGGLQYWHDPALARAGYTRDYLNPELLDMPNATVSHGQLAVDGPSYKALIFDSTQFPTVAASRTSMPVAIAQKLLGFAEAGLPIVIVGKGPSAVPGLDTASDNQVREAISQLLANPHTHVVASEAEVPGLLARIGVLPAAKPATPGPVLSVHRKDANTDFYWLYNQNQNVVPSEPAPIFDPATGEPVDTSFTLNGTGEPFLLDPWDGSINPIELYSKTDTTVTVRVSLAKEASKVIILTTDPGRFGYHRKGWYITSTTASFIRGRANGGVFVGAAKPGQYRTILSSGKTILSTIGSSPPALDLTGQTWTLDAEDWRPANPFSTVGATATQTSKTGVHLTLNGLRAWPGIPALADASGIGVYTTDVTLPASWSRLNGAVLNLGEIFDSFTVLVNGQQVPFSDQLSGEVDLSNFLRPGRNAISIRVATTLNNRLRTLDGVLKDRPKQQYGLIGPVTLQPYSLVLLSTP